MCRPLESVLTSSHLHNLLFYEIYLISHYPCIHTFVSQMAFFFQVFQPTFISIIYFSLIILDVMTVTMMSTYKYPPH